MAKPFFPLKVYGDFFRRSRAANSAVGGRFWPNFELLRALMHVIITCKYEKDRIKNSREKVATRFFPLKPYLLPWKLVVGSGQISNSSKLSCMSSFPASMKWIRSRTAKKKWQHCFSHYVYGDFFRHSRAANSAVRGRMWLNFELLQVPMHVIVTCKYKKDRMKNS